MEVVFTRLLLLKNPRLITGIFVVHSNPAITISL
nr:MAG TPA: hypothetical protein [Caudoviricetes sp.]